VSSINVFRLAAVAAAVAGATVAQAQSVQVDRLCACWVTGLSADGSAAVGMMNNNYATFRWTAAGGVQTLGRNTATDLQGQTAGVPAISADGNVVAATIIDSTHTYGTEGRWTAAGGWHQLRPMPADGGVMDSFDSSVFGMSGDGNTVTGLYWRPNQPGGSAHGSVWTAATGVVGMQTDGRSSRIDGANYDGTVLVGWEEDPQYGERRAAVWVNGTKTILDDGGGVGWPSEASTVNSAGTIIVGQAVDLASQREEATMWTWDGSQWNKKLLGVGPGATASGSAYALGVSDDGSVVVGMYRNKFSTFSSGGFVWTEASGLVDVQGWLLTQGVNLKAHLNILQVPAISADGRVLALLAQQAQQPYAYRSLRVTRLDGAKVK
jgi:uncharacterized membrane protein